MKYTTKMTEVIIDIPLTTDSVITTEVVSDEVKLTSKPISIARGEQLCTATDEQVSTATNEHVSTSTDEQVSTATDEHIPTATDEQVSTATDEQVSTIAKESTSNESEVLCKYCLQNKKELRDITLLLPCQCTNPVCRICLQRYLTNRTKEQDPHCEICRAPYDENIVENILGNRQEEEQTEEEQTEEEQTEEEQTEEEQTEEEQTEEEQTEEEQTEEEQTEEEQTEEEQTRASRKKQSYCTNRACFFVLYLLFNIGGGMFVMTFLFCSTFLSVYVPLAFAIMLPLSIVVCCSLVIQWCIMACCLY